jgi:hypothetical protein
MTTPLAKDHFRAAVEYRDHYQNMLNELGVRVQDPTLGQSVNQYRCDVLRQLKRTFLPPDNKYYKINYLRDLVNDSATLNIIEPQALAEVLVQAKNPANVPRGEIREIKEIDRATGRVSAHKFIGRDSFVKDPAYGNRECRRVLSFSQPLQTIVKYGDRGLLP